MPATPRFYVGKPRKTSRAQGLKPGQSNYIDLTINTEFKGRPGITGYHFDVLVGSGGVVEISTGMSAFVFDPAKYEGQQVAVELKGAQLAIESLGLLSTDWEFKVTALGKTDD